MGVPGKQQPLFVDGALVTPAGLRGGAAPRTLREDRAARVGSEFGFWGTEVRGSGPSLRGDPGTQRRRPWRKLGIGACFGPQVGLPVRTEPDFRGDSPVGTQRAGPSRTGTLRPERGRGNLRPEGVQGGVSDATDPKPGGRERKGGRGREPIGPRLPPAAPNSPQRHSLPGLGPSMVRRFMPPPTSSSRNGIFSHAHPSSPRAPCGPSTPPTGSRLFPRLLELNFRLGWPHPRKFLQMDFSLHCTLSVLQNTASHWVLSDPGGQHRGTCSPIFPPPPFFLRSLPQFCLGIGFSLYFVKR